MDWQRIKERVTQEVLAQLQAGGVEATPQQVQAVLASVTPVAVGDDFRTDVLAVLAGPVSDKVLALLQVLAGAGQLTVVAAEGADRLAGLGVPVLTAGDELTARRLVKGAVRILVPAISTAVVTSLSQMVATNLAGSVLVQAALEGKAVTVARDGAEAPAGANFAVRRKVEEALAGLRTIGFAVTYLEAMAEEVRKTVPAPAPAVKAESAATAPGDWDRELARMIDHTLLKPEATAEQVIKLCKEAREYHFMSVCVNPGWVPLAAEQLAGSDVRVCTVIGFPLGATTTESKAYETANTIAAGATEVDMVINVGALKSGQYDRVLKDIKAVVDAARGKALSKVIIETGLLTDEEKVKACQLSKEAGADFVKTSTGFGPGGATPEDIALMRRTVGPDMGVKASGGVRDYEAAMAVVKAGATRIGASASINIVNRVKPQPTKDKY